MEKLLANHEAKYFRSIKSEMEVFVIENSFGVDLTPIFNKEDSMLSVLSAGDTSFLAPPNEEHSADRELKRYAWKV
jgi:hypothetical protein